MFDEIISLSLIVIIAVPYIMLIKDMNIRWLYVILSIFIVERLQSIIKEHSVDYSGDSVVEKKYDSITISDLTEKYNISGKWWLHVDVEGYDDELIYSLDDNNLPDIIVFEHVNFLEEKRSKLLKWLSDRNYRTELVYMNGVSVRN